jgi:hypothetical protein
MMMVIKPTIITYLYIKLKGSYNQIKNRTWYITY